MLVLDAVLRGLCPVLHVVHPRDNKYSHVLENNEGDGESDITKVTKELQQQTLEDQEKEDEAEADDGACVSFSFTL